MAGRGRTCAERSGPVESFILVLDEGWWQIGKNLLHQSLDDMLDTRSKLPSVNDSVTLPGIGAPQTGEPISKLSKRNERPGSHILSSSGIGPDSGAVHREERT